VKLKNPLISVSVCATLVSESVDFVVDRIKEIVAFATVPLVSL